MEIAEFEKPLVLGNLVEDVNRWIDFYLKILKLNGYSPNTINTYKRELDYFSEYCRGYNEEINFDEINRSFIISSILFREEMSSTGTISQNTKKIYIRSLKSFFVFISLNNMEEKDFITFFDRINIKTRVKKPKHLSKSEIKRLESYLNYLKIKKPKYITYRNIILIKLMLNAGLRISEALKFKLSDITESELNNNFFEIKVLSKGMDEKYAYIMKGDIENDLNNIKKHVNNENKPIMVTSKNKPIDRYQAYAIVKDIMNKAGINKKGLHILRHTFAMRLVEEGVDIMHIQIMLRHADLNSTRIYARSYEKAALDNILKNIG